jgi:hypothetical protein
VHLTSPSRNEKRAATGVEALIGRGEPLGGWQRRRSRIWCYTGGWRCIAQATVLSPACVWLPGNGEGAGTRTPSARKLKCLRRKAAALRPALRGCRAWDGGIKARHWRPPVDMDRRDGRRTRPCFAPGRAMAADPRPPAGQDGRLPECVQEALLQEGCYAFSPKNTLLDSRPLPHSFSACALPHGNRPGAAPTARRC